MATATQAVAEQPELNGFQLPNPVAQVLCGPFTGPGSQAMAVTIGVYPTCWPIQEWAVFSLSGGVWKLVLHRPAFLDGPLVAVGSDIRETQPIFRSGDPRCIPTGGSHARLWHWNGSALVPGPWKRVKAAEPLTVAQFYSPSGNIECGIADQPTRSGNVVCWTTKPARRVMLTADGRLAICRRGPQCTANWGETPRPQRLAYGKQITVGRFRCSSLVSGMRCVVIRSGKGFLINRSGITRVG
jgi:hypothetical protein